MLTMSPEDTACRHAFCQTQKFLFNELLQDIVTGSRDCTIKHWKVKVPSTGSVVFGL